MNLLFLDFESFWDTKNGYGLKTLSMLEYVRSPLFKVHGVGLALNTNGPCWISGGFVQNQLNLIDWKNTAVIAHNTKFDGLILHEIYGKTPAQWICTKAMSKAVLGKSAKSHSLIDLATHFGLEPKGTMRTDGIKDLTPEQEKELSEYCLHDVELCRSLYYQFIEEFPKNQKAYMSWTIESFVNPKLELDVKLLEETNEKEKERRANIFTKIDIEKKTFASNAKFANLLMERGYE